MIDRNFWERIAENWAVAGEEPQAADDEVKETGQICTKGNSSPDAQPGPVFAEERDAKRRPQPDHEKFQELLARHQLPDYAAACQLLTDVGLPEQMDALCRELRLRILALQEAADRFHEVYRPDLHMFYKYYIPETLQLTASYCEYLDAGIGERILQETEKNVLDAGRKLLQALNEEIGEIYQFASIELGAKAKALESLMSRNGYVDPAHKL